MITSKKELKFYITADRIINGFPAICTIKSKIFELFCPQHNILKFLYYMRMCSFYSKKKSSVMSLYYKYRYSKISERLGLSIDYNAFGYGLFIPHYGTIVVGGPNKIGNYAVLHTSTCIAGGGKEIGDCFYLSTGSIVAGICKIGSNVTVAPNSLVNKNCGSDIIIAGSPAIVKGTDYPSWYIRDGMQYIERVELIEKLKKEYCNENID